MALHVAYYTFCWQLRENGKSGRLRPTPATAAGVVDTLWDMGDLYDAVMELEGRRVRAERYERLMNRLRNR